MLFAEDFGFKIAFRADLQKYSFNAGWIDHYRKTTIWKLPAEVGNITHGMLNWKTFYFSILKI